MSKIPDDLFYTEEHEYLRPTDEDDVYLVGITDYAQGELGDVVFLEFPDAGAKFDRMEAFGTIEAVKAVSDLYSPVKAEVLAVNEALEADPALVNSDPYGDGWMLRIRALDENELGELLDASQYAEHIGE